MLPLTPGSTAPARGFAEFREQRYFPALDGLRAVAVLLVFTVHVDAGFWERLDGSAGVSYFFVLSGLLITTLALREESRAGRLDVGGFYLRRVFRIYPLYVLVLGLYCLLVLVLGQQPERRGAFLHSLPFYSGFLPEQALLATGSLEPPFSGAWSLGIEEKFYLVWPLLGFVLLARRNGARAVALVVVVLIGVAAPGYGRLEPLVQPYALIALGALAALALHHARGYRALAVLGRTPLLVAVAALTLWLQVGVRATNLGYPLYVLHGLVATAFVVGLVVTRGRVGRALAWGPLVYLGRISYAFYLTHNFVLNVVQGHLPAGTLYQGGVAVVIALVGAVVLAGLLHRFVEVPLIGLGRRLSHARRDRLADQARTLPA